MNNISAGHEQVYMASSGCGGVAFPAGAPSVPPPPPHTPMLCSGYTHNVIVIPHQEVELEIKSCINL